MTNVLIIEDEPMASRRLGRFLKERTEDISIDVACDGDQGLQAISRFRPDVVFLDVEMPGLGAFELLRKVKRPDFQLIFQTAHAEFAVEAFEKNACDYLLKPFSRERFHEAFDRALGRLGKTERTSLNQFFAKRGDALTSLRASEILFFLSQHHHTYIVSHKGEFIFDRSLSELEPRLDPKVFFRINRQCIVNRTAITRVIGGREIVLEGERKQPISRARRPALRRFLGHGE